MHTFVFVLIPLQESNCLVPECVPLCVLVSYSSNPNLHAKQKHCDRTLLALVMYVIGAKINVPYVNDRKCWGDGCGCLAAD